MTTIADAQREMRFHYGGTFHAQLVSGLLWLASAGLATWGTPRAAITTIVVGGMFIFPATELLRRLAGRPRELSPGNSLNSLGMQVAFVLPMSMPLLLPVARYRLTWFFPALMILVGAHYLPFVFLYGMRIFWFLGALLVGGGLVIAKSLPGSFSVGAWYTGVVLLVFAFIGRAALRSES